MSALRELRLRTASYRRLDGVRGIDARRALIAEVASYASRRFMRGAEYAGRPTLPAMIEAMPIVSTARQVYDWLGIADVAPYLEEFAAVEAALTQRYADVELDNPPEWAVEAATSELLYCLVRALEPDSIVETGIANGHSSYVILAAMHRNGRGRLASVDIRQNVGKLVPDELRDRWTVLHLTRVPPPRVDLERVMAAAAPIDLFIHDGDHQFPGQILDYATAAEHLAEDGLLLSDDVDKTPAWIVAAKRDILPPRRVVLIDQRKALGLASGALP